MRAPIVSIPGGERHSQGHAQMVARSSRAGSSSISAHAILLSKHIDEYGLRLSHVLHSSGGNQRRHDESVCQEGVFDKAVAAIRLARGKGFE